MRPKASLSLDLDNLWSYMKVHGDAGWDAYPTYLDRLVPRVLDFFEKRNLKVTFFVVGKDASLKRNREALAMLTAAGHEIGNHSFHHEPWLQKYTDEQVEDEIGRAEDVIGEVTGRKPEGFRGPGFCVSTGILRVLIRRGYLYDASTLPTFIGPLARAYYFMTSGLAREEKKERDALFGTVRDGLRPVKAYRWRLEDQGLIEIPVTTFPVVRTPFHLSYVLYLGSYSKALARAYFRWACRACRATRVEPSILLHPLDFLGVEDASELEFFPAMKMPVDVKMALVGSALDDLSRRFDVVPMGEHARALDAGGRLKDKAPRFGSRDKGEVSRT